MLREIERGVNRGGGGEKVWVGMVGICGVLIERVGCDEV